MSIKAHTWARSLTVGSPTAKAVLMALADYANDAGVCWPSQETLAKDTEFTSRAVRTAIGKLRELGLITCAMQHRKDGSRTSDKITLAVGSEPNRNVLPVVHEEAGSGGARNVVPEGAERRSGHEPSLNHQENNQERKGEARKPTHPSKPQSAEPTVIPFTKLSDRSMSRRPPTRLPEDWCPDRTYIEAAIAEGLSQDRVERTAAQFRDWHLDKGKESCDWLAAWRRWCRNEAERPTAPPRGPTRGREPPVSGMTANFIEIAKRVAARETIGESARVPGSDPDEILVIGGGAEDEPAGHRGEVRGIAYASGGGSGPSDAVLCEDVRFGGEVCDSGAAANQASFPENAFDLFWHMYPERVGNLAARKAFEAVRISGQVAFQPMMEGLARYKATKPKSRAWCNPTKWLEEGRWDDRIAQGQDDEGRRSTNGFSELAARKVSGDDSAYHDPWQHLDRPGFGRAG